jgi:hypothetical protein
MRRPRGDGAARTPDAGESGRSAARSSIAAPQPQVQFLRRSRAAQAPKFRSSPRFRRLTLRLHALGRRPVGELLIELAAAHGIGDDVLDRLEKFAEIDEQILDAYDGRRWPPVPLEVVR